MSTPLPPPPEAPKAAAPKPIWKRWWFWVTVVAAVGIIGAVAGGSTDEREDQAASDSTTIQTTAPSPAAAESVEPTETSGPEASPSPTEPEPPPEPKPIRLHGSGHQASKTFSLVGGFTTFHVVASGSSNVIVYLVNDRGREVELLVNTIGSYNGVSGIGVKEGEYLIDIDAPSSWTAEIEQPRPASGKAPPQGYSGDSPDVLGPLRLDGLTRVAMKYSGRSNFIVYLLNDRGHTIDLLANEIGNVSSSTAVPGDGGIYWITVDAEGKWSIKVQ